jgi:hypothetical protein
VERRFDVRVVILLPTSRGIPLKAPASPPPNEVGEIRETNDLDPHCEFNLSIVSWASGLALVVKNHAAVRTDQHH